MMKGREVISCFLFFTLAFNTTTLPAHTGKIKEKSDSAEVSLVKLRKLYSANKTIPVEFEKEILTSLSYYPELINVKIKFTYANIFTSMKAVPTMGFLFQKRENRTYRIVMNKKQCCGTNLMQRAPSDALIGVIGHELGHIKDYHERSNFGLLKLLVSYISKKSRTETEKRADRYAVEHNLGEQLIKFNNHIMTDTCLDPKYIKYKRKFYNSSASLSEMIDVHGAVTSF